MDRQVISATELAKRLSDVLNRVRYRHETFVVERNGEPVASIEQAPPDYRRFTVADLVRELGNLKVPPGFGEALDAARQVLREMPEPPIWDS